MSAPRALTLLLPLLLAACATPVTVGRTPPVPVRTPTGSALEALPPPPEPIPVAVYDFPDLTGQFKASETVTSYSRAVTQGAVWVLIDALHLYSVCR